MAEKNLVEEALIQIQNLEEAINENAKEILHSTMKEEISELVKESMKNEAEEEDEFEIEDEIESDDESEEEDRQRHLVVAKNKLTGGWHGTIHCNLDGERSQYLV